MCFGMRSRVALCACSCNLCSRVVGLLVMVYVCRLELMRTALRDHDRDMISTGDSL